MTRDRTTGWQFAAQLALCVAFCLFYKLFVLAAFVGVAVCTVRDWLKRRP